MRFMGADVEPIMLLFRCNMCDRAALYPGFLGHTLALPATLHCDGCDQELPVRLNDTAARAYARAAMGPMGILA